MRTLLTRDEVHQVLTTNLQDWKENADIVEAQALNAELTPDDVSVICSPQFFDDINYENDLFNVLEKHFMDTDLCVYSRDTFILIHNIYNN